MKLIRIAFYSFYFLILTVKSASGQCDFGTGLITGNPSPFSSGSPAVSISGNDVIVVANTTMPGGTYNFNNFTINNGVIVTVSSGSGPLIIRCTGAFTILGSGILNAAGTNGSNGTGGTFSGGIGGAGGAGGGGWGGVGGVGGSAGGPLDGNQGQSFGTSSGGGRGGKGNNQSAPWSAGAGGGGGYSLTGQNGNTTDGGSGGSGGSVYGDPALTTFMIQSSINSNLLGGSGGGGGGNRGSISRAAGGGGGGGGGAIQIIAAAISFGGPGSIISVKGGNGGTSTNNGDAYGGSGGGGSGGTIFLQYNSISGFTAGVNTVVSGGSGGASSGSNGGSAKGGDGAAGRLLAELCNVVSANITTGIITGIPFCAGSPVSVPFTVTGTFNSGNVFTAQLSDASGSFASPISIGTLTGTGNGTVQGTIPVGQIPGSGYRLRVVSSNPAVTGTDNGQNIVISSGPASPVIQHKP